jgi:hypothetical protein
MVDGWSMPMEDNGLVGARPGDCSFLGLGSEQPSASVAVRLRGPRAGLRPGPALWAGAGERRTVELSPRSRRPDTCRQSSIAHTRSTSSSPANRKASSVPSSLAGIVSCPRTFPVAASSATSVCERLCGPAPITLICTVPSLEKCGRRSESAADTRQLGRCHALIKSRR